MYIFGIKLVKRANDPEAIGETVMRIRSRFEFEGIRIACDLTTLNFGGESGVNLFDWPVDVHSAIGVNEFSLSPLTADVPKA